MSFAALQPLVEGNQIWVQAANEMDPAFLTTLSKGQAPNVLWIGCADSRIPETTICGGKPGDIFVHRNIANQFHLEDNSANAVLNYAVLHLGVTQVVVVGHTACGGCKAAFGSAAPAADAPVPEHPLMAFLDPLIKLRHSLPADATIDDLTRENVRVGVQNLTQSSTINEAWALGKQVYVHGWIYDLASGRLSDLGMTQGPK
ncbi:uncharacterized protein CcaverHIS019_0701700 [Cutaneotrichosporon cavernicola]|uniref:Carbonic anhydrase n=1 Tax=Cutaneotrichosporon cavernicola TaxID=279322 RepID=A0AA48L9T0_9TREE|nr:uncharacterized protein CcaverHIS019_0701700 [Cutaneotrichosporon cavernicola]BEI94598.1 hypothetical protein CcaverHIS019_0701700 [Cutaneotrichosporon cavernicola]BEJ02375.1 hypothetical protein CcaverHIS631_0701700 [Cutaneotrichosporon cavernicola]BEJ10132.1 hypothetical protein CcaverHIS641_0701670 [Cutaneotrichosporon cavernicola]